MQLTEQNILALAPDPGTAQRAREVAHARRWLRLEGNGRAIWGELGNPAGPFQVQVDFQGPAFKCTCPVRRLPCKHGIGLLLLFARANDEFRVVDGPPDWVAAWLQKRDERAAKKEPAPAARSAEAENTLAEKRRQNREKRLLQMSAGLAELESWLTDLFRQGLATLEGQAAGYFQELAARMVDAKLGALARRIRQLPLYLTNVGSPFRGSGGWHDKTLRELGGIYLLVKGFQRMGQLPEPLQDDLLNLAGVNFKKEDVLAQDGISDHWLVAGQTETAEEGNLLARRTWLLGEKSGHTCLLLEFAWGGDAFETTWRPGSVLAGEVVFYPSAYPQRVLFKSFEWTDAPITVSSGHGSLAAFARAYAQALSANPWLSPFAAFLENVVPVFQKNAFILVDKERKQLPLDADEELGWKMVAMSGGHPIGVFGQWDGELFLPLSAVVEGQFRLLRFSAPENKPGRSDVPPFSF